VRDELGIGAGERVLAWSALAGGGFAAATPSGLYVLTPFGRRIDRPWHEVDHAAWDPDSRTLAVQWVNGSITPLELDQRSFVPEVVRDRVQASVVLGTRLEVRGGRAVRLALRRDPQGEVFVQVLPDPGVDLADPEVAIRVRQASAGLRAELGG